MTDTRLSMVESVELVRRVQDMERRAKEFAAESMRARDRIIAERDGWRSIARELLEAAGVDVSTTDDIPPLEILELRAEGRLPGSFVPAVQQFWADVTRQHEERRSRRSCKGSFQPARVNGESLHQCAECEARYPGFQLRIPGHAAVRVCEGSNNAGDFDQVGRWFCRGCEQRFNAEQLVDGLIPEHLR